MKSLLYCNGTNHSYGCCFFQVAEHDGRPIFAKDDKVTAAICFLVLGDDEVMLLFVLTEPLGDWSKPSRVTELGMTTF